MKIKFHFLRTFHYVNHDVFFNNNNKHVILTKNRSTFSHTKLSASCCKHSFQMKICSAILIN